MTGHKGVKQWYSNSVCVSPVHDIFILNSCIASQVELA